MWIDVRRLEQFADGGEQDAGVPVDEGGEVGGFSSLEGVAIGGDVKFVCFGVNGEAGLCVQSFELAARLFHGAEFRGVPGGGVGE